MSWTDSEILDRVISLGEACRAWEKGISDDPFLLSQLEAELIRQRNALVQMAREYALQKRIERRKNERKS